MITKPPTIQDVYNFDNFVNTPGVREGLMQRHMDGDPEITLEDTDDGQGLYYTSPYGEQIALGRPESLQLAAGPSPVVSDAGAAFGVYPSPGKRSQKSTIGERMITGAPDFGAGALREGTAVALGFGGDMQKIGRFIGALATDNQGGTLMDKIGRAGKTMEDPTFLPSSEEVSKEGFRIPGTDITIPLPPAVPPGTSALGLTPEERQASAEAGGTVGELVGDPFLLAKGGTMAVKGAVKASKVIAKKAGAK